MQAAGVLGGLPYRLEWSQFAGAPMLMEALNPDAIDAGGIGDAPFVSGVASAIPMRAVSATRSDGAVTALVVPGPSPVRTVADLKGRSVATLKGQTGHFLDLPAGARVAIPNDPTNGGRALLLLQDGGLLTLVAGADTRASVADIAGNPKKIRIVELDAAQIARSLDDVDAAAITGNYAVPAGLDPLHDSLAVEKPDSAYCCLVVVRAGDEARPWAKTLAGGYADPGVKQWVIDTFKGAVVPGA